MDRARRDGTPTIITCRGKSEAVLIGIDAYRRLRETTERYEDEWLNRLADKSEAEGTDGSVSLGEMAALLRSAN
ncbi:type II toxin-antitoxin system Phd/YefM family antitoxin [Streptomyces californicus]|uniref:type II toxin-antitoxin system Phd/YefM family antitoxin n=1 Tax=Streptomyces californicus TaxID=67351 RepID=UPI003792A7C7